MFVPLLTTITFAQSEPQMMPTEHGTTQVGIASAEILTSEPQMMPTEHGTLTVKLSHEDIILGEVTKLKIDFINPQTKEVQEHIDYTVTVSKDNEDIFGPIPLTHTSEGTVRIPIEFVEEGMHEVYIEVEGILFQPIPIETVMFGVAVGDVQTDTSDIKGEDTSGGCLIATATYGSELATQVQQLRELRDNTILETESGAAFMTAFNQIYYSFSPSVADFAREHLAFKEITKIVLTPMLSSLTILNHIEIGSDEELLSYGIPILLLNIGMYAGLPIMGILKIYQCKRR